jgi:pimeloyl-ACP methyl ester carboxylesterase
VKPVRGDHAFTLPSGRTIGYAVRGDPAGMVVLNCHGGLVSGHDVDPADQHAQALGLCIVSPDRPGVGRTDRLPGYGMIPWVRADVIPLLEDLDVGHFSVMGWSEGGQYALSVAFELRARVTRCAVIAGCLPLDEASTHSELNRLDRTLIDLAHRRPLLVRGYSRVTGALAAVSPGLLMRAAMRGLPKLEVDAIKAQGRWLPTILGEGARQPRGCVDEYLAISAPWGFTPEDIDVPVRVFQGGADALVPATWGSALADRIPGARLTSFPNEGHFVALTRSREILHYLAGHEQPPDHDCGAPDHPLA